MRTRARVAINSNETVIAAQARARLAAPVAEETVAVRELISIKSPSTLVSRSSSTFELHRPFTRLLRSANMTLGKLLVTPVAGC